MEFKKGSESVWEEYAEANQNSYGSNIRASAERIADHVEAQIAEGIDEAEAFAAAHRREEQEYPWHSTLSYGCMVMTLAQTWEHGAGFNAWASANVIQDLPDYSAATAVRT